MPFSARPRWLAPAVILTAGALAALPACGGGPPMPTVTGSFAADPVVTIPAGQPSATLRAETVIQGRGRVVQPDDYVITDVQAKVWAGDRLVIDTFTSRQPQGIVLSGGMPAWRDLAGHQVGSRVVMVVPPKDGFGPRGDSQLNVMGGDTLVLVFDILRAVPRHAAADGAPVPYAPGPGLPSVTWSHTGPLIAVPTAAPPENLVVRLLRRGFGARIRTRETVATQYTGVVWRTGRVFDSTWARGFPQSFVLGAGQMIPAWDAGLGGLRVGSRVLLVVPPDLAYGRAAQPPYINSGDTLVFAVDIIAAVQP